MRIKQYLEIEAPVTITKNEAVKSDPTICKLCNGRGGTYIDSRDPGFIFERGEYYQACSICEGSGKVQAIVNIDWVSAGEVLEQYKSKTATK